MQRSVKPRTRKSKEEEEEDEAAVEPEQEDPPPEKDPKAPLPRFFMQCN